MYLEGINLKRRKGEEGRCGKKEEKRDILENCR
jgi:hypothetical protein